MTIVARLEVTPIEDDGLAEELDSAVAALDEFDISHEIIPLKTVIAGESVEEVFAAARAAHEAVDADKVRTSLEVDEQPEHDRAVSEPSTDMEAEPDEPPPQR